MSSGRYRQSQSGSASGAVSLGLVMLGLAGILVVSWMAISFFRVSVPYEHFAVMIRKTGEDIPNTDEIAPTENHKGIQRAILSEGVYWRDRFNWDWEIHPLVQIPQGKLGVLISLTGDELPEGEFLASVDPAIDVLQGGVTSKGIVDPVLRPGRYAINPYLFQYELHEPVVVPAGYKGVVTRLAGPLSDTSNTLLVPDGRRGVQQTTYDAETIYCNPYSERISLVDCRSQRFNLSTNRDMGFPSKDGFWVSLDGIIEFRIRPEKAAEVFMQYNDAQNGDETAEEIIRKVITPIARSFCRVEGSKKSGRDFISGETRSDFEVRFQQAMRDKCEPLGIEVIQALITEIRPPEQIAKPVRDRELAHQKERQFHQQIAQQKSEQDLAVGKELVLRKRALVEVQQQVVKIVTEASREQEVAVTKANERLKVADFRLLAAKDEAEAILSRGKAEADVVRFQNAAEAAGWKDSVNAFGGNGHEFARYVLNQKLASSYRRIMANTADSPIMDVFQSFLEGPTGPREGRSQPVATDAAQTAASQ